MFSSLFDFFGSMLSLLGYGFVTWRDDPEGP